MSVTTFTTQRQLMRKNMPEAALTGPFAQQQKILLYVFPVIFAVSGVSFPIGVLLYWLTTNIWTMGQQFYVIRRMPAPGSQAEKDLQARRAARGKTGPVGANGAAGAETADATAVEEPPVRQRQQPKRQPRGKRTPAPRRPPGSPPGKQPGKAGGAAGNGSEAEAS
jgi:YidC/Oxa1 family membrane protein insertase